jgi:hypothetical protein
MRNGRWFFPIVLVVLSTTWTFAGGLFTCYIIMADAFDDFKCATSDEA